MSTFFSILLATFLVSLLSFSGVCILLIAKKFLEKIILGLVALAGGGLLGGAFLHLIPESIQKTGLNETSLLMLFLFVLCGFSLFLFIEQFLHWHHHHRLNACTCEKQEFFSKKTVSYLVLFGDGVHNLIDGIIIAASFVISLDIGIVTTIAVALHEIPQEIGDFGVLVYNGYNRQKALLFNFLSGLIAVFGGVIGYIFAQQAESAVLFLLPIAAGAFIYIAASDLVPEIKHTNHGLKITFHLGFFILGIALMLFFKFLPFAE